MITIPTAFAESIGQKLAQLDRDPPQKSAGVAHVIYGGAHLFSSQAPTKLGARGRSAMELWGSSSPLAFGALFGVEDEALAYAITKRVEAKLATHPVEAMCIDFEDGFGPRANEEEDREAIRAATELALLTTTTNRTATHNTTRIGIRIKALSGATTARAIRTLDLFVTTLAQHQGGNDGSKIREGFSVTLPKVSRGEEVSALVDLLEHLEKVLHLATPIAIELMIETPRALMDPAPLVKASRGRVRAVHLGAYDLTASLGVTAGDQRLDHPVCDLARAQLQLTFAESSITVVDGATTLLPIAKKDESVAHSRDAIHRAWRVHGTNVTRAMDVGIWQGWDLHPHQLPARYGALFSHFLSRMSTLAERLKNFIEQGVTASRVGQVFDDAATGNGLMTFFRRGLACGAFDAAEISESTGLSMAELSSSFPEIVASRAKR